MTLSSKMAGGFACGTGGEMVNNAGNDAGRRCRARLCLHRIFPIGLMASLAIGVPGPAAAQDHEFVERYGAEYTAGSLEKDAKPDGPIFAVVSIANQRISVYGSGGLVARSSVSTGMRGHATPTGVFSIVQKQRFHESNIYSGAPMPLMQRITWSGIALHQGVVPGHPASHGCIRLPGGFAQRLFSATQIGQRVIVAPSDVAPVEIMHANLPAPKLSPAPNVALAGGLDAPDETASVNTAQEDDDAVLEQASLQDEPASGGRLNPIEFARAMKSEANSKTKAASQANKAAMLLVAKVNGELRIASRKLAGAENAAEDAARDLAAAVRRLEKTDGKEAIAEAAEAKAEADTALVEAQKAREERIAKATEAVNEAERALTEAQKAKEATLAKASEAKSKDDAALAETQKAAAEASPGEAVEANGQAGPNPAEAQKAEAEAPPSQATEANGQAAAVPAQGQNAEEPRVETATEPKTEAGPASAAAQTEADEARLAEAMEAKSEAEEALAEVRKAEEKHIAKATETKSDAEEALIEAQKAEEKRVARATEAKSEAEEALIEAQTAEETRIAKATETKAQAETALTEARKTAEEARAAKDAKQQELAAARIAAAEAKAAGKAAAAMLAESKRRLKPLSVFISRKTGRLYVRQDFAPLFDVPVSIRDADREIGTHVYVSTRAVEDGSALIWQAVSMPEAESPAARRKHRKDAQDNAPPSAAPEAETARGALDRITIPEETSQRLAALAWIGASVIISDNGMSGETGPTTDFIILTRPKPSTR
jgi:hypothetical protein